MKKRSLSIVLISLILGAFSLNISAADKNDPVGKWNFKIIGAPYGYELGTFEIEKDKKVYSGSMKFTGLDYKFLLEEVSYIEGKLGFSLYVEGQDILIVLEFSDKDKLSGKVAYSEGELGMTAERLKDEK